MSPRPLPKLMRGLRSTLTTVRHKPLLFPRIARAVAAAAAGRTPHWQSSVSITQQCNLNCEHCFSKQFDKRAAKEKRPPLTTAELIGFIEEANELGVFAYDFQGGEVFLHPDLEAIVAACRPDRTYIGLITNGLLLDETWARRLRGWGVDKICVSIDSALPEEHDRFRRLQGSWQAAMTAVDLASRVGFRVMVLTTVTHDSLYTEGFRKLVDLCVERGIVNWLFIGIPVGNWQGQTGVLMDAKDHAFIDELRRRTGGLVARDIHPHLLRTRQGCPAVTESIHMTAFGDVMPCPFTHVSLGNVREHHLEDIIRRGLTIPELTGSRPVCPIGEDRRFIDKVGRRTFDTDLGPLPAAEIFGLETVLPPRRFALGAGSGTLGRKPR